MRHSSASRRAARSPTSAAAIPIRREVLPIRRVRRVDFRTACAALLLACSPVVIAASAEQFFAAGRLAFEQHDYERALSSFKAAASAGLSGPAVHFNIGVAAYRLARYDDAEAAFRKAAATPEMAALAHYNLGLVALRRNDQRMAANWFARAREGAADDRLRSLAAAQLASLPPTPERDWVAYASLGAGYDDNVALVSDADVLGVSGVDDSFTEAQVAFGAPLGAPWRVEGGAILLDYHELSAFDQLNAYGGARYQWQAQRWSHEAYVSLGYSMLDDERFETARTLGVQTTYWPEADWRTRLRYRYSDVDAVAEFAGLTGARHEAQLELRRGWTTWELTCDYTYNRRDLEDPDLASRSHEAGLELTRSMRTDWTIGTHAQARATRYDSGDEQQDLIVSMRLSRRLTPRWRIAAVYSYTNSDADVAAFDYVRHRVSAAIEAQL